MISEIKYTFYFRRKEAGHIHSLDKVKPKSKGASNSMLNLWGSTTSSGLPLGCRSPLYPHPQQHTQPIFPSWLNFIVAVISGGHHMALAIFKIARVPLLGTL